MEWKHQLFREVITTTTTTTTTTKLDAQVYMIGVPKVILSLCLYGERNCVGSNLKFECKRKCKQQKQQQQQLTKTQGKSSFSLFSNLRKRNQLSCTHFHFHSHMNMTIRCITFVIWSCLNTTSSNLVCRPVGWLAFRKRLITMRKRERERDREEGL